MHGPVDWAPDRLVTWRSDPTVGDLLNVLGSLDPNLPVATCGAVLRGIDGVRIATTSGGERVVVLEIAD